MSRPCCIQGSVHEGNPVGRVETVHGLPTYISDPPGGEAPKAFIVMIPDAFGWDFVNLRLLGDIYARRSGARVYMPDFMNGNAMDPETLLMMDVVMNPAPSWFSVLTNKIPTIFTVLGRFLPFMFKVRQGVSEPIVRKFFNDLRLNEGADVKIASTGYCWGGKYVTLLCHGDAKAGNGKPLIDCGFTAHASNLVVPDDIVKVEQPLSMSIGDVDMALSIDKVKIAKKILEEDKEKGRHEVVILPGAKHGFSVRAHPNDKKEVEQAQIAEDQAINWFHKYCGTNKG